jgi:prepilin-type N-terminal cleavage/methylation domain-containing protein
MLTKLIYMKLYTSQSGFTLIELLVVISIISVMSSVILSNLNDARASARDTVRISDMHQIRTAFELFYYDNRRYPGSTDGISGGGELIGVGNPIDTALLPYLTPIPRDPLHDAGAGLSPTNGALYFYSYDPQHIVYLPVCTIDPVGDGLSGLTASGGVFGFNKSETQGVVKQDTCSGSNVNLNNADFNEAIFPMPQ